MDGANGDFSNEEIFPSVGAFGNLMIGQVYFELLPVYGSLILKSDTLRYAFLFKKSKGPLYLAKVVHTDFPPKLLPEAVIFKIFKYGAGIS